jgi:hypothetical protein
VVRIVRPEEMLTVPFQTMNKHSLLQDKDTKFCQPSEDSQEFQFGSRLAGVRSSLLSESFQFVVNGAVIESDFAEAAALFRGIREQLSVDGCSRKFFVQDSDIEAADILSLQFLLSGESIFMKRSQGLLNRFLGNETLELLFLGSSKSDIQKSLLDLVKERRIDLDFAGLSNLSFEALDTLLLSESVSMESEDALLRFILKLGPDSRDLLRHIQLVFLSEDGLSLLEEHFGIPPESLWQCAAERITHPPLNSRIISEFPDIFAEFRKKQFSLLWRGSRDGFKVKEFHRRCDRHGNTLTVILDTNGNVFGGFTPLEWESRVWNGKSGKDDNCIKTDGSCQSFVFTLKNPHDISARKFALKFEMKHQAIICDSKRGPHFGDIGIREDCNTAFVNATSLGTSYTNDTGLGGKGFFTGELNFKVKEIEVFEITD